MAAKGKVNASNVQINDRIIVKTNAKDLDGNTVLRESATKSGEGVTVARVIGKTFRAAQGPYEARGKYIIETTEGSFEAAPIQTMWFAAETAPAVKAAHVEALAVEAERAADAEAALADQEAAQAREVAKASLPVRVATPEPAAPVEAATKIEDTQAIVGTMEGHRGIMFVFTMKGGKPAKRVTFDFYGAGANFNGATYARLESAALGAMGKAHLLAQVHTFTHFLIR